MTRPRLLLLELLLAMSCPPVVYAALPAPVTDAQWAGDPGYVQAACGTSSASFELYEAPSAEGGCILSVAKVLEDGSVVPGEELARYSRDCENLGGELRCQPNGSAVAVLPDIDRSSLWRIDPNGEVVGTPYFFTYSECAWAELTLLAPNGDIVLIGNCWNYETNSARIHVSRLSLTAEAPTDPQWIAVGSAGFRDLTANMDAAGNILLVWNEYLQPYPSSASRLLAQALRVDGSLSGPAFRIDSFDPPRVFLQGVSAPGEGLFAVYWHSYPERGGLTRTVSMDPDIFAVTTTTTTTLPPSPDAPMFRRPRSVGRNISDLDDRSLYDKMLFGFSGDGNGSLLLRRWRGGGDLYLSDPTPVESSLYASSSAGLRWSQTAEVYSPYDQYHDLPARDGISANGTTVSVQSMFLNDSIGDEEDYKRLLVSRRSTDQGQSWSGPETLVTERCFDRCRDFAFHETAIASDGNGNWLAAWVRGDESPGYYSLRAIDLEVSWSSDDGRSWSPPRRVWSRQSWIFGGGHPGEWHYPIVVVSGHDGSWGLASRDPADGELMVIRVSTSGSDVQRLTSPSEAYDLQFHSAPALAALPSGVWVLAWEEKDPPPGFGSDSDIFFSRSPDHGQSWSEPRPLNAYAHVDAAQDGHPSLGVDAEGRILAAWVAHGSPATTEGDIVSSISIDEGQSWSPPALVDSGATTDQSRDHAPMVAGDSRGRFTVAWSVVPSNLSWWQNDSDDVLVAVAGASCGDGIIDHGEQCDDGNAIDDDDCSTNCALPGCGNEILEDGEICDSLARGSAGACSFDCEPAVCGDGIRDLWSEEICDDGNVDDSDECPGSCQYAWCGDGYRHSSEPCDDGNRQDDDACRNDCRLAFCGDGRVQTGVELCDDGNRFEGDACTELCLPAVCGDGRVNADVEQCDDPGGVRYGGACSTDCRLTGVCGDANASGSVTASDALSVLRCAVGLGNDCGLERCDLDGNGRITTNDALSVLRLSVNVDEPEQCPIVQSLTFRLADSRRFGALQFAVEPSAAGLEFGFGDGNARCEAAGTVLGFASNIVERRLLIGIVSLSGIQGPTDLARCRVFVYRNAPPLEGAIELTIQDASTPDGQTVDPLPRIEIRTN